MRACIRWSPVAPLLVVLGMPLAAHANQPPGPQLLLAEVSLLPLMILLSLAGGAYAILQTLSPKARRWRFLRAAGAVLAILVSGASGGIAFVVAAIFGVLALQRGIQMVRWGIQASPGGERPPHLVPASRARLVPAGAVLLFVTVFLLGLIVAFVGYGPRPDGERQQALRTFVAYQIARARGAQAQDAQPSASTRPTAAACPVRLPVHARIDYAPSGTGFTVLMFPRARFPFFPYNLLATQPSTRADESGKIRMVDVHAQDAPCPPDAPVVAVVGEPEIARMQSLIATTPECQ